MSPLPLIPRILAVAVLWYLWHLNFLLPQVSLKMQLIHFASLVLGSWGLLKIAQCTRSLLFVAAVHLSFNVLNDVNTQFGGKLLILFAAVVLWAILIVTVVRRSGGLQRFPS